MEFFTLWSMFPRPWIVLELSCECYEILHLLSSLFGQGPDPKDEIWELIVGCYDFVNASSLVKKIVTLQMLYESIAALICYCFPVPLKDE